MIIFVDFVWSHLRVRPQVTYEIAYKNTPVQNFISQLLSLFRPVNEANTLFFISYFK